MAGCEKNEIANANSRQHDRKLVRDGLIHSTLVLDRVVPNNTLRVRLTPSQRRIAEKGPPFSLPKLESSLRPNDPVTVQVLQNYLDPIMAALYHITNTLNNFSNTLNRTECDNNSCKSRRVFPPDSSARSVNIRSKL